MDGNYFELIAQEIIKQKQRMDQLEAENRELRQRLADLRAGRGIFVDIAGSRFALRDSPSPRDHVARTR
jgi:cell division protein FtsB